MASSARAWIVAAHPDDETIGASWLLGSCPNLRVVHVTNGAPRDPRWWPSGVGDRVAYIQLRDREAERALSAVGASRIALGVDDQAAIFELDAIVRELARLLAVDAPDLIVTHAYEGGHPDHDAVAVAVARACTLAGARPLVLEMALYHGEGGTLHAAEFIGDAPQLRVRLSARELACRRRMLASYESQHRVLEPFVAVEVERYRRARVPDVSRAPHEGPLWYEQLGMGPPAARWRELAASTIGGAQC